MLIVILLYIILGFFLGSIIISIIYRQYILNDFSQENFEFFSISNTFVGTNITGVPKVAENGEGFICEPHDIEYISSRFRDLLLKKN